MGTLRPVALRTIAVGALRTVVAVEVTTLGTVTAALLPAMRRDHGGLATTTLVYEGLQSTHNVNRLEAFAHQVRQDLGVGLRGEGMPPALEGLPDGGGVLDDAVVDHRDAFMAVQVGVSVGFAGLAVGGPARVTHADRSLRPVTAQGLLEAIELARLLEDRQFAVEQSDTCRIVAAVF